MKIIISPAKSLDFEQAAPTSLYSQPSFLSDSTRLQKKLKTLSAKKLGALMKISDALSALNYDRNQSWQTPFTPANSKQAIYAFTGEVFKGIDAASLPPAKIPAMQQQVRILSGLYGLLKPLDLIQPYRLEMGTKLQVGRAANLYKFWGTQLSDALNEELQGSDFLVNLASTEYSKALPKNSLKVPVITPVFKEFKNGNYKIVMLFAKRARGEMVRYILDNQITTVDGLKNFTVGGYQFHEAFSTETELVFTR